MFSFLFLHYKKMRKKIQKNKVDWYVVTRIRDLRMAKGYSQDDLAIHLEVTRGFIGQVESPNYRAKYKTLHLNDLARLLECSPKDFWPQDPI